MGYRFLITPSFPHTIPHAFVLILLSFLTMSCIDETMLMLKDSTEQPAAISTETIVAATAPTIAFNEAKLSSCTNSFITLLLKERLANDIDIGEAAPTVPDVFVTFDDPAVSTLLADLAGALCAPVQPYRATLEYPVNSASAGAPASVHIEVEVSTFQQYAVMNEAGICIRNGDKAYHQQDGHWQEFLNIDTPACGNPLDILPMMFVPPPPAPIRGSVTNSGVQELDGQQAAVYLIALTLPIDFDPAAVLAVQLSLWIDTTSRLPLRIVYQLIDDPNDSTSSAIVPATSMSQWTIDIEQGIDLTQPLLAIILSKGS